MTTCIIEKLLAGEGAKVINQPASIYMYVHCVGIVAG